MTMAISSEDSPSSGSCNPDNPAGNPVPPSPSVNNNTKMQSGNVDTYLGHLAHLDHQGMDQPDHLDSPYHPPPPHGPMLSPLGPPPPHLPPMPPGMSPHQMNNNIKWENPGPTYAPLVKVKND